MHTHSHQRTRAVLAFSLLATFVYIVVLVITGLRANSLALLSEAGHNASDFLALLLSSVAVYLHSRPADEARTYGYHRAGVLAAFLNALTLVGVAGFIFYEAAQRLRTPEPVVARTMMIVAAIGVVLNLVIAVMIHRTGSDVNLRAVLIHQVGDVLSTAAVIAGGWIITQTGLSWIDPALSVAIGVLILWSSVGIIRETLNILLEGTPRGIKLEEIAGAIRARSGVQDVHDLHVWSIGSEVHALSCHVAIPDLPLSESEAILRDVQHLLAHKFNIHHTTIQFEHVECDIAHGCIIPVQEGHSHTH